MSSKTNAGRSAVPLTETHNFGREALRLIPDLGHAAWRDYCGLHIGLPVDEYVDAGDIQRSLVILNATEAHGIIVDFLAKESGKVAAEDFVCVVLEGKTVPEQASARDVSRSTVRNNIRTVRDRLPLIVDELEAEQ